MTKVVIFGCGKLAELAYFYLKNDSPYSVAAFTVDKDFIRTERFQGLPLLPFEDIERHYPPDQYKMFIAIGYKKLNFLRAEKYKAAREKNYEFISYVSSKATHWGDVIVGDNCFILENQVIQPAVRIGNDVVIWSGNHFGHNVVIGDHCWISSHAVLSGGVSVGSNTFIGINATIRDDVKIGRECIIGAGAVILKDVNDKEVYIARQTELYRLDSEHFERMMDISK